MARTSKTHAGKEKSLRAAFERNLSEEFFETLDGDPTMVEELYFHRLRVTEEFVDRLNNDPVLARVERISREMFVESSLSLISCSPTDAAAIAEAQVNILAATKIMDIFASAITDGAQAKTERKATNTDEE